MGGILRSLAIAEQAKQIGIPIIIGAQVGETSILTRAALTLATLPTPTETLPSLKRERLVLICWKRIL